MKETTILLAALFTASAACAEGVQNLHWLLGCWQNGNGSEREAWAAEADGSLLGFGLTIAAGRVAFYELLSIVQAADGSLVYTAHPAGQSRTALTAMKIDELSVTFSNPAHDYPQEIAYRLDGDTLIATISAQDCERPRTFEKRRCD